MLSRLRSSKSKKSIKTVSASRVMGSYMVLPGDTNTMGTIFGGKIMAWVDMIGAMAATRHCRTPVVTASIDDLHFITPIRLSDVVHLAAEVICTGKTSMEVEVNVIAEERLTGKKQCTCVAFLTFVSVNKNGKPVAVAPITPETADEKMRFKLAQERKQERIARFRKYPISCRWMEAV